jgi:hypothetical protein
MRPNPRSGGSEPAARASAAMTLTVAAMYRNLGDNSFWVCNATGRPTPR